LKLALDRGLVQINLWNIRDWGQGSTRASMTDRSAAAGMVIMPEPVFDAVERYGRTIRTPDCWFLLTPAASA